MKKTTLLLGMMLHALISHAQADPAVYGAQITPNRLKQLLYGLASDTMEGRETGMPGQIKAAAFLEHYYRDLRIQAANQGKYPQYYTLWEDTLKKSLLCAGKRTFVFGMDYYGSVKENHIETQRLDDLIFAGYGIDDPLYSDYSHLDVRGKAVMVCLGEPRLNDSAYRITRNVQPSSWSRNAQARVRAAEAHGAKVLFIISPFFTKPVDARTLGRFRHSGSYVEKDTTAPGINYYFISPTMAEALLGRKAMVGVDRAIQQRKMLYPEVKRNIKEIWDKAVLEFQASNILAYIPGTVKKNELLVISAHYDHLGIQNGQLYPGADDDGSGTVAVMEIARAFAKAVAQGHGPLRSILFLHVSGEEKGLLGSSYYTTHPVYPLKNTFADLNIDMIGRIDPMHSRDTNYVYIVGDDKLSSEMRPISVGANEKYTHLSLDYKYNDPKDPQRIYYRSDHYNFARYDIPIIFYFDGLHPDYHQPTDTPDKIEYGLLAKRAQLVFYTAWTLANQDQRPVVDRHQK